MRRKGRRGGGKEGGGREEKRGKRMTHVIVSHDHQTQLVGVPRYFSRVYLQRKREKRERGRRGWGGSDGEIVFATSDRECICVCACVCVCVCVCVNVMCVYLCKYRSYNLNYNGLYIRFQLENASLLAEIYEFVNMHCLLRVPQTLFTFHTGPLDSIY